MALVIKDLSVQANGNKLLNKVNIDIEEGETFALFGPNGSGKSSLINAIAGNPAYRVVKGSIHFSGKDVTSLDMPERVKLGIATSFQQPPEVKGVTLKDMINICLKRKPGQALDEKTIAIVKRFDLERFLDRNINVDFSGGEKKRADLLQVLLMRPKLLMLDEPDSGVDLVSLKLISEQIAEYLKESNASVLIITHQGEILNHLQAKRACILYKGENYCFHSPQEILADIRKNGYEGCLNCHKR